MSSVFKILSHGDTVHSILKTSLCFIGLNILGRIFVSKKPISFVRRSGKAFVFPIHMEILSDECYVSINPALSAEFHVQMVDC